MAAGHSKHTSTASAYNQTKLFESIIQALEQSGISTNAITTKDLSKFDEFHIGGRPATRQLAKEAGLQKGMKVLDLGCGLGGPARLLSDEFGCEVTGIDLTEEYIRTATLLSKLTNHPTQFIQGDASDLPFENASFDVVWTQHLQMNIANKKQFYTEAARVLRKNGKFVYYDILQKSNGSITYPVPWATDGSMNFLISSDELKNLLLEAGLIESHRKNVQLPALAPTLLVNEERLQNLNANFQSGKISLESGLFIKP